MRTIRNWNDRIVRLQDKGSRFTLVEREEYKQKITKNMAEGGSHKIITQDPTRKHMNIVSKWARHWVNEGEIDETTYNFMTSPRAKPGNVTGLIKAHKEDYPLRIITTGCSTAIEHLSAFTEYYLAPLARKHPSYIKDTTHMHFFNKINESNQTHSFPPGTLLVAWDIEAMFPNIDNKAGLRTIKKTYDSSHIQSPSTKCLMEAVKICLIL